MCIGGGTTLFNIPIRKFGWSTLDGFKVTTLTALLLNKDKNEKIRLSKRRKRYGRLNNKRMLEKKLEGHNRL